MRSNANRNQLSTSQKIQKLAHITMMSFFASCSNFNRKREKFSRAFPPLNLILFLSDFREMKNQHLRAPIFA